MTKKRKAKVVEQVTQKYFGIFESRADIQKQFQENDNTKLFPTEDEILFAVYDYEDYSGSAQVVFTRDGKLYEVQGGHCSCNGLEEQWEPSEVTAESLEMRWSREHSSEAKEAFAAVAMALKGAAKA